jgi:hypothetical protein
MKPEGSPVLCLAPIKRVSDWQMTEEAQRAALAALIHAISCLDTTLHWCEGRTSVSDGQRFAMPAKSCNRPTIPGSATPPLRSRIRRSLLKVEQLHALARDVYSGTSQPD